MHLKEFCRIIDMLKPRIIPSLLIYKNGLIKTENFKIKDSKYIGDPLNAVRIFNEKNADEIIISDVTPSIEKTEPNYDLISKIAEECRMPLCYSGGIKKLEQIEKIISLGVEKVGLCSICINNPELISKAAKRVGSQSIAAIMDVKKNSLISSYKVFIDNGKKSTDYTPLKFLKRFQDLGAGEIIINNINNDGKMNGYDFNLLDSIYKSSRIPLTTLGGAGCYEDIKNTFNRYGIIGAAAGSLFIFKGKYKAVLIQYPTKKEKEALYQYNIKKNYL